MPSVNFSVPEDVKLAFNTAFEGQNKSAIIADLMREAVARAERRLRSVAAYERIARRRAKAPAVTTQAIRAARESSRT